MDPRWLRGLLAVLVLAAQGCWFQTGGGPERRGFNGRETEITTANVADLEQRWSAFVGGADEPLVSGNVVYLRAGAIVDARRLETGASLWTTIGLEGVGQPVIYAGRLHVPITGGGCSLTSLDLSTGSVVATRRFGLPNLNEMPEGTSSCGFSSAALEVDGKVVLSWGYLGIGPTPECPAGLLATGPGVIALDLEPPDDGWERRDVLMVCGPPYPGPPEQFAKSSSDGTVVLHARGSTLDATPVDCVDPCGAAWSVDVGTRIVGPAVVLTGNDYALSTHLGQVMVIDGVTHQVEWTASVGANPTELAASDTTIFVGTRDGRLAAFARAGCGAATCTPMWTAALGAVVSHRPTIAADVVYVAAHDGTVFAFDAEGCGKATCEALWVGSVPAAPTSAPVVASGVVMVRSTRITAFALPDSATSP